MLGFARASQVGKSAHLLQYRTYKIRAFTVKIDQNISSQNCDIANLSLNQKSKSKFELSITLIYKIL